MPSSKEESLGQKIKREEISQMLNFPTGNYWGYWGGKDTIQGGTIFFPTLNQKKSDNLIQRHWNKETQTLTPID